MSLLLQFFFLLLGIVDGKVEFTSSTLYDIFDFRGVGEIALPRCNFGCLIFASTLGEYQPSNDGLDPYMENLMIYDPAIGRNLSIAELANQLDSKSSQKVPLDIASEGVYSILNLNAPEDEGSDVTVWIVERSKAHEFDYELYDARSIARATSRPTGIVTIMSAARFRVSASDMGQFDSYTARLVGFDNALDNNPDKCTHACQTAIGSAFVGFEFIVNAPLISIVFSEMRLLNLTADYSYYYVHPLATPGFFSSPGYNGCGRLGTDQVHRSTQYSDKAAFTLRGAPNNYQVVFDSDLDLSDGNEIQITDDTNDKVYPINGTSAHIETIIPRTQTVIVSYKNISAPQSFILRYSAAKLVWYLLDILGSCCRTNSMRISGGINAFVGFIFNNLEAFDAHINQHDANDDDQLVRTNYWTGRSLRHRNRVHL
ncbi:hypothetical protein PRIPAC_78300, partial [Pristionchus pacificus]|uniref:Uncharacterized protein n=1 Tax=Pristionchus pacificus TaxID=54126 RepID=A0A2A6CK35_PRIPA